MDNLFKTMGEESDELFDGFDFTEDIDSLLSQSDNFEEELSDKEIDDMLNTDKNFINEDFEDEDIDNWDDTEAIEDAEFDNTFEGFDDDLLKEDNIDSDDEDDFFDV